MVTEKVTMRSEAIFSDDHEHRFVLRKVWQKDKPLACIVMLNPCESGLLITDLTTNLVINNLSRLCDYGGVVIVNLFSQITPKLRFRHTMIEELNSPENDTYIAKVASECSVVILAWGKAADSSIHIANRIETVLDILEPYKEKLMVITDGHRKLLHPLSPQLRKQWRLIPYEPAEN